jgi:glycosyltransferase involved in cell wall biosynthesis
MPIKVLLDDSPMRDGNAIRGVGAYTKFLAQFLGKDKNLDLALAREKRTDFKAEIIHYPFFDLFFSTLPVIKRSKTIVTIHDVIPLLFPKHYLVGKKGILALIRQKLALRNVDAVITDSENSKTDIAKYLRFPLEKIQVIYLAANPELKAASQQEIASVIRKYKLPKKYLLYVGDINYNKNIPQLIKTIKFLPKDIKLVCVGKNFRPQNIPEWQAIEAQLALSNVAERVKFLTEIGGEGSADLAAIYSGALAYIQPSLYEGFGLPILEAMTCQTPVICANNSSLPEVALNKAIVVEEAKAENFALAVEEILAWKKTERENFIKLAAAHAKKFTWLKTAKATAAVYKEVLKK